MEHHVDITRTDNDDPSIPSAFHAKCTACGWAAVTHDEAQARALGAEHETSDQAIPVPAVPSPD